MIAIVTLDVCHQPAPNWSVYCIQIARIPCFECQICVKSIIFIKYLVKNNQCVNKYLYFCDGECMYLYTFFTTNETTHYIFIN